MEDAHTKKEDRPIYKDSETPTHKGAHPHPQSTLLHRNPHRPKRAHPHRARGAEDKAVAFTSHPIGYDIDTTASTHTASKEGDTPSEDAERAWTDTSKRTDYHLQTSHPCQTAQYKKVAHLPLQAQQLLAHLLAVQTGGYGSTPFIPYDVLHRDITDCPYKTATVWKPLKEEGWIDVAPHSYSRGDARVFSLTDTFWTMWDTTYIEDAPSTRDVAGGKRLRRSRTLHSTTLSDDSGNRYSGLVSHTLQAAKDGVRVTVDYDALVRLMQRREAEIDALPADHEDLPRLQERLRGDRQRMATMKAQCPEDEGDGLLSYEVAYEVQEGSGRVTEKGGGVQGLTQEAKHVALSGIEDLFNYDLKGAHQSIAVAFCDHVGIECTPIRTFDKARLMYDIGCTRGESKAMCYGTFNTAAVPVSDAQAQVWEKHSGQDITVSTILRGAASRHNRDLDDLYAKAYTTLHPIQKTIREAVDIYTTSFFEARQTHGRGGVRLTNASGVRMGSKDSADRTDRVAALCHLLQGSEAAVGHALTALQDHYGYRVVSHQHDGVITEGRIPQAAIEEALQMVSEAAGFDLTGLQMILKPYWDEAGMPQHWTTHHDNEDYEDEDEDEDEDGFYEAGRPFPRQRPAAVPAATPARPERRPARRRE